MDQDNLKDKDLFVDLEIGGTSCEEDDSDGYVSGDMLEDKFLTWTSTGVLETHGVTESGSNSNSYKKSKKTSGPPHEKIKPAKDGNFVEYREENVPLLVQKCVKEKHRTTNSKKASKPPRPPRGPSLDASDMKLVKEISELAMKKRARNERIKALKKMKAAKSPSSSSFLLSKSTLYALVVTLFFCIVIIFQGLSFKNDSRSSPEGSPEPAVVTSGSTSYLANVFASERSGPGSEPPNFAAQHSGLQSEDGGVEFIK